MVTEVENTLLSGRMFSRWRKSKRQSIGFPMKLNITKLKVEQLCSSVTHTNFENDS